MALSRLLRFGISGSSSRSCPRDLRFVSELGILGWMEFRMLKIYLLFCFFLSNGLFCFMKELVLQSPLLMVTFKMNLICILIGLRQSVNQPKVNLDTIIWVFVYMFFFLAPIVQIKFSAYFPNSLPILKEDVIK